MAGDGWCDATPRQRVVLVAERREGEWENGGRASKFPQGGWKLALQGTTKGVPIGRLSETVTIEAITGAEVNSTFDLSGTVTLEVETSEFTYDETGRVDGSRTVDSREESGPLTMRGEFSAPYHTPGAPRMLGYRSVVLE